jgi:hypothetical protein
MGELIIMTGPPGAGKSTVSGLVADGFDSSVLIPADWFFGLWRRGAIDPWLPQALPQTSVAAAAAAAAAGVFASADCRVVYDGFIPPRDLPGFATAARLSVLHYAVILPPVTTCVDHDGWHRCSSQCGREPGDLTGSDPRCCAPGDRIVTAMSAVLSTPGAPGLPDVPVTSVAGAIARMEAIEAALPAQDGLACFNRMYLDVTSQVNNQIEQGFYADPAFMTQLDVTFANLYFAAEDVAGNPAAAPLAWRPLVERRAVMGIESIQFALAGMNAHINYDLPVAVVSTCAAQATSPEADQHFADYQKVDQLLDAAEQSIRHSFETAAELALDQHLSAVATLICNWTINSARDLAWNNARLLWAVRDNPLARGLFLDSLAASTALASRMLLVAV